MSKSPRFTLEQISVMPPAIRRQVEAEYARQRPPAAVQAIAAATVAAVVEAAAPGYPRALPKPRKAGRVPRTRNGGTITEAAYWGMLRSCLRRAFRYWKPAIAALTAARVASKGPRGRKWLYFCADCGKLFPRKGVQIDHVEPCGQLTSYAHLPDFIRRLTPEGADAYRVRCLKCHGTKTAGERAARDRA